MLENYTLRSQANFGRSHFGIDAQRKITAQVWNSCLCEIKRSYNTAFTLEKKKKRKEKKKIKSKLMNRLSTIAGCAKSVPFI